MKTLKSLVSAGVALTAMGVSIGHAGELVLVDDGQPKAVVATADAP